MFMATISLRLYKVYHPKFTAIIKQKYDLFIVLAFYDKVLQRQNVQIRNKAHQFILRVLQFYAFS
jgi:hypothetical protein